jgi:hypothetical protein
MGVLERGERVGRELAAVHAVSDDDFLCAFALSVVIRLKTEPSPGLSSVGAFAVTALR